MASDNGFHYNTWLDLKLNIEVNAQKSRILIGLPLAVI